MFSRNTPKYLFLNLIKKTKKYLSKSSTEENGKEKSVLKFFIQKKEKVWSILKLKRRDMDQKKIKKENQKKLKKRKKMKFFHNIHFEPK